MSADQVFRIGEIAEEFGVSWKTLRKWRKIWRVYEDERRKKGDH